MGLVLFWVSVIYLKRKLVLVVFLGLGFNGSVIKRDGFCFCVKFSIYLGVFGRVVVGFSVIFGWRWVYI